MTTAELSDNLKKLSLLKNDGATQEIRDEAAAKHAAIKTRLAEELEKMKSHAYWRK